MTRKNFSIYANTHNDLRIEAKKILSSIFETLSVEELDSLYTPTEVKPNEVKPEVSLKHTVLPFTSQEPIINQPLSPIPADMATVGKIAGQDKLEIATKKPIKVVFKDASGAPLNTNDMMEGAEIIDGKVVISVPKSKECEQDYDFLSSAPPLDLTSDPDAGSSVIEEPPVEIKALTDIVKAASDGMMPTVVAISGQPLPTDRVRIAPHQVSKDAIRPIEEDPEGFSVVGMDNDIGVDFMKKPAIKK